MEQCIAVSGVRTVELETATGNLPAVAFWRRHGYRDTELLKRYYGNGLDAYLMIKSLATALSGKLASAH